MASAKKLNVLVYTGSGTTVESVRHCIFTLRRLLSPNYAVIPIAEAALLKEPWTSSCALLVIPGGADLAYCRVLDGPGNRLIAQFVRRGGAYLGLCAGGYYASRRCEFEVGNPALEVVGPRELAFFPGTCRGGAFAGFRYQSEKGARAVRLAVAKEAFAGLPTPPDAFRSYYNGGGVFVQAETLADQGIEILAEYEDVLAVESGARKAALVYCKLGSGGAILTGAHPEFAPENFHHQPDVPGYGQLVKSIAETDAARVQFLKACLAKLGLEVSLEASAVPSLSKLHLSALSSSDVPKLVQSLAAVVTKEDGEDYIKGENDLFHLEKPDSRWDLRALSQALTIEYDKPEERQSPRGTPDPASEYHKVPKSIVSHLVSWPGPRETPSFNHALFYSSLQEYRSQEKDARSWGDTLLYGEVVTSTNTLLEKNITLLSKLPTGFTLTATTQVTGRGRGSNVWVSPAGSLIMSTVINHPADLATSRPIVFIQYLTAIAIVEAIQSYDDGFEGLPVKLKWPNDIYALDPTSEAATQPARARARAPPSAYVKIGGILANCAYSAGSYQVVLGIGLNANNGRPTTSLDALLPLLSAGAPKPRPAPFRIERLVARILTRLEALYGDFCRDGFAPRLERRYYGHWLHTDQIVTLEAEGGVRARVLGITPDWGLLRAEEVREDGIDGALRGSGRLWALQSDENSFDFWKGLVKRKL